MQKTHVYHLPFFIIALIMVAALQAGNEESYAKRMLQEMKYGASEVREFVRSPETTPKDLLFLALINRRSHDQDEASTIKRLQEMTFQLGNMSYYGDDRPVTPEENPTQVFFRNTELAICNFGQHKAFLKTAHMDNARHNISSILDNLLLMGSPIPILLRNSRFGTALMATAGVICKGHSLLGPRHNIKVIEETIQIDEHNYDRLQRQACAQDQEWTSNASASSDSLPEDD